MPLHSIKNNYFFMRKLDILDKTLVDATSAKAKESPRLRMNHNFHPELSVSSQKLAID
jgi:hypothetical protein